MKLSERILEGEFHQYEDGQNCDDPTDVDTNAIAREAIKLEDELDELKAKIDGMDYT